MSEILFRMAAKTDVGLERANNEDNFQASANLEEAPMRWVNNQQYSLGHKGALLVVADGMGGMNAGEVASEIAINTIRDCFSPENITDEIAKNRFTIEKFMKGVVVEADKRIKEFAKENPESRGMGTTIVIAWLFDGYLYVTWCGDSRAYVYNPNTGLFQISKDHSYVQQLVDAGKISKEDAFDFPDSNIITRSLSDSSPKANPDCLLMPQKLCNGDIILLCSDGLNGMIRDEEIENVIANHQDNMTECVDALIKAALDAAGADNCTVALCQILSGGVQSNPNRIPDYSASENTANKENLPKENNKTWFGVLLGLLFLCMIGGGIWYYFTKGNCTRRGVTFIVDSDSINAMGRDSVEKVETDTISGPLVVPAQKVKSDSTQKAKEDSSANATIKNVVKQIKKRDPINNKDHKKNQTKEDSLQMNQIIKSSNKRAE